jgi:hypothetical protein
MTAAAIDFAFRPASYWDSTAPESIFLPPGEVEIARVVLQSVPHLVTSLRARRAGGRIHYRMVDEMVYESDGNWTLCQKTSRRPLSFGELVDLIIRAEDADDDLTGDYPVAIMDWNVDMGTANADEMARFVRMESVFYPQLGQWWEERVADWLEGRRQAATEEE